MLKADRIGLVIVLASLSAIAAIAYMVFQYQHSDRLDDIRGQGVSLVRALSGVPYDQLVFGGEQQGFLQVLRHGAEDNDFAYVSIVDRTGRSVNEVVASGLIVPAVDVPSEPSAWLGEAQLELPPDGRKIIEFHAPLLAAGDLQGFVRLGYRYPAFGLDMSQLPFFAAVSLPVFLLVPLFYFLLRREIRPIREASNEINRLIDGENYRQVEIAATGELGDFMQRFNRFVQLAGSRIEGLEQNQKRLITSTKLLTYRKNRVETVLETLPEAVLILDESGTITFANQKLAALFGVSPEVILAQSPQEWCDNPDILQLLAKHRSDGKGRSFTDTIRFNLNTVGQQSIVTKTYPLFAPNKPSSAMGTLIIFRDETQEALARQARGDFVAHLSHELKSPLNVLAMYSESLLGEAGKTEEFRIEAANVIADEVDRLSTLITGLLNMTQIENGSLTPDRSIVKLRDVASAAFEEARHSASDKDYVFKFDAPKEMSPVLVDKDLIRIAITNLLSNAVKYNCDGGEVRLTIEETEDAVQIRVADTGIGVSEDEAAKIFDKFYRSTDDRVRSISGHGLGLALTKQIIELHHGSLSLNHERAEGAEFIINLWKETTAVKQAI
ncbi:MAG: ATP-binding protein [Gammaproteobacteria bacterium]|nr:ATP-binding protein [Gammaproteobacteria bacterium]MDH3373488.1 ATP-binding protein [Gammaproteobacteria bacterium]MDH3408244.1 ATP-binding protein [Gammaproteobacteria bacterium]